jgi:hypothetical protein
MNLHNLADFAACSLPIIIACFVIFSCIFSDPSEP